MNSGNRKKHNESDFQIEPRFHVGPEHELAFVEIWRCSRAWIVWDFNYVDLHTNCNRSAKRGLLLQLYAGPVT